MVSLFSKEGTFIKLNAHRIAPCPGSSSLCFYVIAIILKIPILKLPCQPNPAPRVIPVNTRKFYKKHTGE